MCGQLSVKRSAVRIPRYRTLQRGLDIGHNVGLGHKSRLLQRCISRINTYTARSVRGTVTTISWVSRDKLSTFIINPKE